MRCVWRRAEPAHSRLCHTFHLYLNCVRIGPYHLRLPESSRWGRSHDFKYQICLQRYRPSTSAWGLALQIPWLFDVLFSLSELELLSSSGEGWHARSFWVLQRIAVLQVSSTEPSPIPHRRCLHRDHQVSNFLIGSLFVWNPSSCKAGRWSSRLQLSCAVCSSLNCLRVWRSLSAGSAL